METIGLSQANTNKFRIMKREIETSILGVILKDRIINEEIRRRTGVKGKFAELK